MSTHPTTTAPHPTARHNSSLPPPNIPSFAQLSASIDLPVYHLQSLPRNRIAAIALLSPLWGKIVQAFEFELDRLEALQAAHDSEQQRLSASVERLNSEVASLHFQNHLLHTAINMC